MTTTTIQQIQTIKEIQEEYNRKIEELKNKVIELQKTTEKLIKFYNKLLLAVKYAYQYDFYIDSEFLFSVKNKNNLVVAVKRETYNTLSKKDREIIDKVLEFIKKFDNRVKLLIEAYREKYKLYKVYYEYEGEKFDDYLKAVEVAADDYMLIDRQVYLTELAYDVCSILNIDTKNRDADSDSILKEIEKRVKEELEKVGYFDLIEKIEERLKELEKPIKKLEKEIERLEKERDRKIREILKEIDSKKEWIAVYTIWEYLDIELEELGRVEKYVTMYVAKHNDKEFFVKIYDDGDMIEYYIEKNDYTIKLIEEAKKKREEWERKKLEERKKQYEIVKAEFENISRILEKYYRLEKSIISEEKLEEFYIPVEASIRVYNDNKQVAFITIDAKRIEITLEEYLKKECYFELMTYLERVAFKNSSKRKEFSKNGRRVRIIKVTPGEIKLIYL